MTLIALVDSRWGIAKNGRQICFIPDDLRRFQHITTRKTVVMGRTTYESIGHPLPNRENLVLSHKPDFSPPGVKVIQGVEEIGSPPGERVYVIGGESVYRQLLPHCDTAMITKIEADMGADQSIPDLDINANWDLISSTGLIWGGETGYRYKTYRRKCENEKRGHL